MTSELLFSVEKHIGFITLNRPKALNALSFAMIQALQQCLQQWEQEPNIHAVVIQAAEGRAFCAGGDIRWLYEKALAKSTEPMQFFLNEYRLNYFLHNFSKPYIALMNGITMGGGVGISLHGSYPLATENFAFAMPETGIGFFPDIGASYLLAHCPDHWGIYLGLTGQRLNAQQAFFCGLIKYFIPEKNLPVLLAQLKETDLAVAPHQAVAACIEQWSEPVATTPATAMQTIVRECFSKPTVEEIMQALQAFHDPCASEILEDLNKKSPISLKVSLLQLQKARDLSLADCLNMDYCLMQHFLQNHDFFEGVRALLIDKDKMPRWQPVRVENISEAQVRPYFLDQQRSIIL